MKTNEEWYKIYHDGSHGKKTRFSFTFDFDKGIMDVVRAAKQEVFSEIENRFQGDDILIDESDWIQLKKKHLHPIPDSDTEKRSES